MDDTKASLDDATMIEAHTLGRAHGAEAFAKLASNAEQHYNDDINYQLSYMAGYIAELRRLANKYVTLTSI